MEDVAVIDQSSFRMAATHPLRELHGPLEKIRVRAFVEVWRLRLISGAAGGRAIDRD